MHPLRISLAAVLFALVVRCEPTTGQQNYGAFSSGLDQDGGLQPAVGGYE